jgi:hypothetical protein
LERNPGLNYRIPLGFKPSHPISTLIVLVVFSYFTSGEV